MQDGLNYEEFNIFLNPTNTTFRFDEFTDKSIISYFENFRFIRNINAVHIHHTWRPNYSNFNGSNHQALQSAMQRFHINAGFGDIAQHVTVFPDGKILLGRDFNSTPASISGRNTGAFCIEQVGDFDKGKDTITGPQLRSTIAITRWLTQRKKAQIVYHNEHSPKTCPGSGFMSKEQFEAIVKDDLTGHWAEQDFRKFIELGIIGGFPDGTYRPNEPMTRAQFVAATSKLVKVLGESYDRFKK